MKPLYFFLILLFTATASKAQQAGQLYITSYDDTGQIIFVCDGQPRGSVPVSGMASGIYLGLVTSEVGTETAKIVVQH